MDDAPITSSRWPTVVTFVALGLTWVAMILVVNDRFVMSFSFALLAFACDFLDGWLARKLRSVSVLGQQVDATVDILLYVIYPAVVFAWRFELNAVGDLLALSVFVSSGLFRIIRFTRLGFIPSPSGKPAYAGLPIVFSLAVVLVFWGLSALPIGSRRWIEDGLLVGVSWLMVLRFPFPKPQRSVPFFFVALAATAVLLAIFAHGR